MRGQAWAQEQIATVVRMRAEGRTHPEIGAAVGRSAGAVDALIHRLRANGAPIESRKRRSAWTAERIAEARRLKAEGLTNAQVGRRLGVTGDYLGHVLARLGDRAIEAEPGEPVPVNRIPLDPRQVARELEQARAALTRAERRYQEVMAPIHQVVRGAIDAARLLPVDLTEPERDLAEDLCAALRDRGYVIVEASRA